MNRITEIFLDMDGVIADFESHYTEKFGISASEMRKSRDRKEYGASWEAFVRDREFQNLPWFPGGKELIGYLNGLPIPTTILSSSGGEKFHEEVTLQKYYWLDDRNIQYMRNIVAGRSKKKLFAHSHALLIDDTHDVVEAFREGGGHAILHRSFIETKDKIEAIRLNDWNMLE